MGGVPRLGMIQMLGTISATGSEAAWAAMIEPNKKASGTTASGPNASIASAVSAANSAAGPAMNRSRTLCNRTNGFFVSQSLMGSWADSSAVRCGGRRQGEKLQPAAVAAASMVGSASTCT